MTNGMEQLPLFGLDEGRAARDAGAQRAADHAGLLWQEFAFLALKGLAVTKREIHTDDLAESLSWEPPHPNAYGAIWLRAIKAGLIEWSGEMRASKQPGKHAHSYKLYRSLIYGQGEA